jgi:hypothetical protein
MALKDAFGQQPQAPLVRSRTSRELPVSAHQARVGGQKSFTIRNIVNGAELPVARGSTREVGEAVRDRIRSVLRLSPGSGRAPLESRSRPHRRFTGFDGREFDVRSLPRRRWEGLRRHCVWLADPLTRVHLSAVQFERGALFRSRRSTYDDHAGRGAADRTRSHGAMVATDDLGA